MPIPSFFNEQTNSSRSSILLIEACDFEGYPVGGQLAFAKQLLQSFGNRFALIGISTDSTPVGRWVKRQIDGVNYDFFSVDKVDITSDSKIKRPIIPLRIFHYIALKRHMNAIRQIKSRYVFTQSAQSMLAINKYKWESICYCFPSVKNEVEFSRYPWVRFLSKPYEKALFKSLTKADVILAAADNDAIKSMLYRSNGVVESSKVISCPTCSNTKIFNVTDQAVARSSLGLTNNKKIILTCGKLMYIKGWDLLLQSLSKLNDENLDIQLIFVGEGEDRESLLYMAKNLKIFNRILLTGSISPVQVAKYMNAADLFVVGSIHEGWSVAMVEAISCGLPIVSTEVSGANDLIYNGKNGFIVKKRDPELYARAIIKALDLPRPNPTSLEIADQYSLDKLPKKLKSAWAPLAYEN